MSINSRVLARFWSKVNKNGPIPEHRPELGACWIWTAALQNRGYGFFNVGKGMVLAHRFAWTLLRGPIPKGRELDHLCHNGSGCVGGIACPHRACVNPAHLTPKTGKENKLAGEAPSAQNARKTHCKNGHLFDEANTRITRAGDRDCRTCDRERKRAARAVK